MNKTAVAQQTKATSFLPPFQGILQRKCACGNHTVAGGECAECAKKEMGLQRKLTIGASNDLLEQEADRIADQVMAAPLNSTIRNMPPRIQRFTGQSTEGLDIAPASVDHVLASPGRPLEPAVRQDMEQRFGHDFTQVRVHTGSSAEQSARDVNANAYTVGHNIVFGVGQFEPGTNGGRRLIAHELTHVIQQSSAIVTSGLPLGLVGRASKQKIVQRNEDRTTSETVPTVSPPISSSRLEETRSEGQESVARILISCQDMRLKIVTAGTIYSYQLEECRIPLGSYETQVTVTGNDFYLNFGEQVSGNEEFSFRYRVEPGQENPATLLSDIGQIHVDVVESLPPPQPPPPRSESETTPTCAIRLDDRELVPAGSTTRNLFDPRGFSQTLWAHEIPLGQFGWVEVEATASGSLTGNFNGNYGPGRLTDICLTHIIDRQSSSAPIEHPLLGRGSRADVTTFGIGGRARFRLPARAVIGINASGALRIAGDYLSVIELAAAEATLSADAGATLNGAINGSVEIVASAIHSEAYLENNIHPIPVLPVTYILPDTISIENTAIEGIDLAAEVGLQGHAGVSFRGDLSAGFDLAGINIWNQTWNLASFNAGVSWSGGLRYSPNPGIHWDLGSLNVGDDLDLGLNEDEVEHETGIREDSADVEEEDIISAILDETQAQVSSPNGSDGANALPFDWYKPLELYVEELNLPNAEEPNVINRGEGPTLVRYLQGSRTIYETLGVADWPAVNRTFQYIPYDVRRTPEQSRFNRLLDRLGHDRTGTDAEHVWDVKLRGLEYDRFDNLWPASNQEQQLAGTRHQNQINNYKRTIGNVNGRWFKIVRVRHPA